MLPKTQGAIAAGHRKTVEAGQEMFRLGGNAFDAAVAGVMASFVVEPTLTSPAGGGFLLAHTQQGENLLFDFFTQTPRQQRQLDQIDFRPVVVNFGSVTQEFHIGMGSIAVPGTIGGLLHVHKRLGRLPLQVVAEPAIHYARAGVEMTEFQAYCFGLLSPILLDNPGSRAVFAPQGNLPKSGEQFAISDLADSLGHLVAEGAEGFYAGELGQQLVRDCQAKGGYLTMADLQNYQVIERKPLLANYRGHTVLTNPPPSAGGSLIMFALALLESVKLPEFGTAAHLALLARVMQLTNLARVDGLSENFTQNFDQNIDVDSAKQFLSAAHIATYRAQLTGYTNKWGSTTHLSTIDNEGNAASVTTSNGEGSAYVIPGTGIMANNMLGEADLHPQGFHTWQPNVRISSMMSPTMILQDGKPEIVLGTGGANRIRTAIFQVISNLLDFNMSVEEAVTSPRVHWEDGLFNVEPGFAAFASGPIAGQLAEIDPSQFPFDSLELWSQQNMFFGGVHAVSAGLKGAGDQRRSGEVGCSK